MPLHSWLRNGWWVDPDSRRENWRSGPAAHEALRMGLIRCHQYLLSCRNPLRCLTTVNGRRREQPDPTVMMLMVVPLKEHPCPGTRICRTAELGWKARPILQRLELCLRIGIV